MPGAKQKAGRLRGGEFQNLEEDRVKWMAGPQGKQKTGILLVTLLVFILAGALWWKKEVLSGYGLDQKPSDNRSVLADDRKTEYSADEENTQGSADDGEAVREDLTVALTFDDGPHPVWTEKLLDGLKERGIRATFFVIGQSVKEHPELVRRMIKEGNQVGNHTYSHVQLTACKQSTALEEIKKTQDVIYQETGFRPLYIRPPFGSWSAALQKKSRMETVLWDVDPYDWKVQNTDQIVKQILKQTEDGSIILLHDIYETSVDAALEVADIFLQRGYRFCTVEEIMIE